MPHCQSAADRVAQHEFELGTVKGALAREQLVGLQIHAVQRILERALELVPDGVRTDAVFRPVGKLDDHVLETEIPVDIEHQRDDVDALLLHLFLGAVDVRIVLREVAHAQQPCNAPEGS